MIKTIKNAVMLSMLTLVLSASAQNDKVISFNDADTSLFKAGELSVNGVGSVQANGNDQVVFGAGVSYSLTPNVIVEAEAPLYQSANGFDLNQFGAGLAFRIPVTRNLAPTVRGGTTYNWNRENFNGYVGLALEIKLNEKWSLSPGVDYQFGRVDRFDNGVFVPKLSIRWTF